MTAALAGADLIREDSGFVAATVMGMVLANQRTLDVSNVLEFEGTVVQLLIGVLFILISASVKPSTVSSLLPEGGADRRDGARHPPARSRAGDISIPAQPCRAHIHGLAGPARNRRRRDSFGLWTGTREGRDQRCGQDRSISFIAIFGTVAVYGLTAAPLARGLGLAGTGTKVSVLVVGGHAWARKVAGALGEAGVRTRLCTWKADEQAAVRAAGLTEIERLAADLEARESQLEDITDVLLLTESDGFRRRCAARPSVSG